MFYVKIATALEKVTPSFPATPLEKLRSCQAPSFLKIWLEVKPPSRKGGRGGGNSHDGLSPPNHASQKIMLMSISIIHDVPFKLEEAI